MLKIRKSEERGHVQFTWQDLRHSFSFGSYYDLSFMGFQNACRRIALHGEFI